MEGFVQYGSWIFIDPDEHLIDLIDEDIDLEALCELIRCDSTDLLNLGDNYLGFVDGEGAWQERQMYRPPSRRSSSGSETSKWTTLSRILDSAASFFSNA